MYSNKEIIKIIRAYCERENTSLTKLEEQFRWGNGTIGKWAKAKKAPPIDKLMLIADALNVTIADITGEQKISALEDESGLDKDDLAILNLILSLPDEKKKEAMNYLHYLASSSES